MATLIAIVTIVLTLVVVVLQHVQRRRVHDHVAWDLRGPTPTFEINHEALESYLRELAPVLGPVPLGGTLTMTGDPGLGVRLQAIRGNATDVNSYTVRVHNAGTKPIDGSLSTVHGWLDFADGSTVGSTGMQVVTAGHSVPSEIAPASDANLFLIFDVPAQVRPVRLRVSLRLGRHFPTAEWTLTP